MSLPGMLAAALVLAASASLSATVAYVVDGDTIALRGGPHVRLVQIDTPEVGTGECYSRRAAKDLRKLLPDGTRIELQSDPRLDSVDRYGRLLRYVFRGTLNVNLRLVEQGDATVWFYHGDRGRYASKLLAAARRARTEKRGLWGACRTVWNPDEPATTEPKHVGSAPHGRCDASYPTLCIPPPPPDLDCVAAACVRRWAPSGPASAEPQATPRTAHTKHPTQHVITMTLSSRSFDSRRLG